MDMPFGRQREPVRCTFIGHPMDVAFYIDHIRELIERTSYDNAKRLDHDKLMIYPRAVND